MRQLDPWSPEIQGINFVDNNLKSVHSVELVLDAGEDAFKKPET